MIKRLALLAALATALLLTACGGPNLNELKVHNFARDDDKFTVDVSFDKEYDNVKLVFHSDVDSDEFEGTAEYKYDLGKVESGKMYTEKVTAEDGWEYSGKFKNLTMGNGSFNIEPPDLSKEKIKVIVKNGDKELTTSEAK